VFVQLAGKPCVWVTDCESSMPCQNVRLWKYSECYFLDGRVSRREQSSTVEPLTFNVVQ